MLVSAHIILLLTVGSRRNTIISVPDYRLISLTMNWHQAPEDFIDSSETLNER